MQNSLRALVTEASLAKLAGAGSYARGAAYFASGAVIDLVQTRGAIKARVMGSEEDRVELRPGTGRLAWSCTCPLGEEGEFCKHAVAAGLAWLARPEEASDELSEIRAHLEGESKEALMELVLDQAANDPELRARLQAAALRRRPPSDLKAMKEAVRKASAVRGFVDYHGMRTVIYRADAVADLLRDLLGKRRAAEAAELAGYAMRRGIAAYEETDDSGGGFGDTLHRIAALYLDACRAAKPEPEALGKNLFELLMLDQWGFFKFEDYAPLLEKKGLARYRALAESAWEKVPALEPGAKREYDTARSRVAEIMQALARHDGDADALVAVKARDLSHPYRFVEIAEILAKAGRHDAALAWAERGRKAFPRDLDARLVEFLVEAYHRVKRHDEALALAWEAFTGHPGLEAYKRLAKCAGRAKTWKVWREKAFAHVRAESQRVGRGRRDWHWSAGGRTLLVEIFLHEGDSDAALAEAKAGGCTRDAWMKLARAREKEHPQDAGEIYRARIDGIINIKHNRAYDEAADLAGRIK
ncbi:MAG: SWIM zinc finger family protein, partial [Burkholderiales bacterium]